MQAEVAGRGLLRLGKGGGKRGAERDHARPGGGDEGVAVAERGHEAYASDVAAHGIELTERRLSESGLSARTAVAVMTECPWHDVTFHGILTWDYRGHGRTPRPENIRNLSMERNADDLVACAYTAPSPVRVFASDL